MSDLNEQHESNQNNNQDQKWERKLLEKVAMSHAVELRRNRRWKFFGRILIVFAVFAYILFINSISVNGISQMSAGSDGPHIGFVDVLGPIAFESQANAGIVGAGLRAAMKNEDTVAVMLRINSPGGSPVQSDLIYSEILRLRSEHPEKPVYAVIGDIGASGAYYIASAAEKIYASPSSIVGSIGVTSGGSFGFVDAIEKLGVERRIYTSGNNKAFLDPFLPEKADDKVRFESMLANVHQQFIRAVEDERAERITDRTKVFNGHIWTGEESKKLGLIDDFGSIRSIAREEFDNLEEFVNYTPKQDFLTRFADRIGASAARTLVEIFSPTPSFK